MKKNIFYVIFASLLATAALAQVTLQTDKSDYRAGEAVAIQFAGGPGGYMDSVDIWRNDSGKWVRAGGNFVWSKKQGEVRLTPPEPGQYEVRFVTERGATLATRAFKVGASAPAVPAESAASPGGVPAGTYQTYFYGVGGYINKWLAGDIVIRKGGSYEFQHKTGNYYFDAATRRIIWKDGPLQGVTARFEPTSGVHKPAIVLPRKENDASGHKLAITDIWGYLK